MIIERSSNYFARTQLQIESQKYAAEKNGKMNSDKKQNQKSKIRNPKSVDVAIIGGGAAGISAALWCDELGLSARLLEKSSELGGQLLWTFNQIKNHLGTEAENGRELQKIFVRQIENRKFQITTNAEITRVEFDNKRIILATGEEFSAKALIIATGVRRRALNVEGEDVLAGKGMLESGKKDRAKAAGRQAIIVGGGDAAIENALILAETAKQVKIIHRRRSFRARSEFLEQARANSKIEFLTPYVVRKISGDDEIENVEIENLETGETRSIEAGAVLVRIGVAPNTENFRKKINLDENGYIITNHACETNLEGIYVAGDVANPVSPTVSTAVGTGATAAKSIYAWLNAHSRL